MREEDCEAELHRMVADQIKRRGITSIQVLSAMRKVPRHRFVPKAERRSAYSDGPLSIGDGQTISQPYMVALMTQCLDLARGDNVLEVGTGSGYQTAILAEIVGAGEGSGRVYTVERVASLSRRAAGVLGAMGYGNIEFEVSDGSLGWSEKAPFDAIIVTAGAPEVPASLVEQLIIGGRLVVPVGSRFHQSLYKIVHGEERDHEERHTGCVFVPLIGDQGWKD